MFTLNCRGRLVAFNKPVVMGIINVTPNSFYAGSRQAAADEVLGKATQMLQEGAAILDLGGQSTRPGSETISPGEEADRVLPAVEAIMQQFPGCLVSVDTYYSSVASQAVAAGASIVNDISAGTLDKDMLATVAQLHVPYIAMHMKGAPVTMQQLAQYEDVTSEVLDYFIQKVEACRLAGIHDVIIDPGFGFAKTIGHNFALLNQMEILGILQKPILAGLSRKATVYKTLGVTAEQALNGTTVLNTIALQKGANILRVHDVKEAVQAIALFRALRPA